jgi:hypothetical protein
MSFDNPLPDWHITNPNFSPFEEEIEEEIEEESPDEEFFEE